MGRLISLARAARLVGTSRGQLQSLVAQGRLASADGCIDLDELQVCFPQISVQERVQDSGAFERVRQIREEAFARRMRELALPSKEILAQRLFHASVELAEVQRLLQSYHALLQMVRSGLSEGVPSAVAGRTMVEAIDEGLKGIFASESRTVDEKASILEVATVQVTVRPSGHHFLVEGSDTLLQAGLKAGLPLAYGCGGGNCGLCKARLIAGELRPIAHSDLRLTQREREQGVHLLCTHTAVTDVVIESVEASGPEDIPVQEIVAKVRSVTRMDSGVMTLHVQTPRSHRLRFLAGQAVTLGVATPQGDRVESMPLASCPCDERNLLFHMDAASRGDVAALVQTGQLTAGTEISVRGPFGDFVLDSAPGRDPVFVSCGTGFAPVKSLIEHAIALDGFARMSLYCLNLGTEAFYADRLCRSWADSLDHFRYVVLSDADAIAGARQVVARLITDLITSDDCPVYVSGAFAFVDAFESTWAATGQSRERLKCFVLP